MRERTLKRWEPAADEVNMSLEGNTGDTTGWDQFEANERLFGAKSNYDENIYTTRIDRSDPTYRSKQVEAARIAREIEGTNVENPHMREERGLVAPDTGDQDEEAKYSGVQRDNKVFPPLASGQPNKYTPPARRQPGAQPPAGATQPPATLAASQPLAQEPGADKQQGMPVPTINAEGQSTTDVSAATTSAALPERGVAEDATANVEVKVLDKFREFANSEKMKMQERQERRRNQASYDRTIKLNELMKFSQSFKLSTPVPKDLVPILAKDPHKQEAIIQRAQQSTDDKTSPQVNTPTLEQKQSARAAGPSGGVPPVAPSDRANQSRGRQGFLPTGPLAGSGGRFPQQPFHPGRQDTGMLSHRLADNLQQRKGAGVGPVPAPLPIQDARGPPTGPASEQARITSPVKASTPSSAASSKFNVRAMEFKPNPAASTFTPGGAPAAAPSPAPAPVAPATAPGPAPTASTSPRPFSRNRSTSRATSPSAFFGSRKPQSITDRPSIDDQFNPIKRMKKENAEATEKPFSFNGGITYPYRTPPTWEAPEGNEEKTYDQMFRQPTGVPSVSPQGRSVSNNPHLPQQHQMSFQYQQGNPGMPTPSGPPNGSGIHQGPHGHTSNHMDDHHRMQLSASSSQVFPSPRMGQSHMGYSSPMTPHAQVGYGQPVPPFYNGPQPAHMRHYQGGPHFVNPQAAMGAPMMAQQTSNGPYMGVPGGMSPYTPQMQMYSPSPGHAYPHMPPQSHSGYPSPSRGAPVMMHQNSQSGQPPQSMLFMSPGQPGHSKLHNTDQVSFLFLILLSSASESRWVPPAASLRFESAPGTSIPPSSASHPKQRLQSSSTDAAPDVF